MPGVTEQEIAQAKQMNLYQYMQLCEPDNFKPEGPGQFRHKGHSSLTFAEDGSWTYFKTKATGRTALNYLIAVEGVSFVEAVREINRIQGGVRPSFQPVKAPSPPAEKKPAKEFRLPKPDKNNYAATAYLRKRCIHPNVLTVCKQMVNKSEATTSPDGEITFNVGNDFSYDLVYEDETHGTIRGAKLIQQIDEENHVEPVQVILSENQIKAMSIRGVTIHLPQNGIERLFIPEKYVLRDLDAGQCTVLLYPNQQYSYVPIGDSKKRLNIQGDRLSEFLGSSINPITESTGLKRKIAAVERRAGIENAKFLGKMLQGMTDSRIYTTGDYDKVIHNLGKTQIGLTNELAEVKQKRATYAAAAKHLQICKTYKPVWMEYAAKPLNQKMEYFNQHSTELQAYRNAAAYLEKESIDQSVEIDKVNVLAQEMGHRMDELVEQLRDVNLQEQKVRQEQQTLAEIQSDLVE